MSTAILHLIKQRHNTVILPLDNALRELTAYRSSLEKNRWRTDVQSRITTIEIIETLIRERLYPRSKN